MIALAISCLLVSAVILALLSATDSLMRGWHSYAALAKELRALRATGGEDTSDALAGLRTGKTRLPASRTPRPAALRQRAAIVGFRAAA